MNGAIQIFLDRVADAPLAKSQITITRAEADAIAAVVKQRHGPMTEPEFWQQAYIAHVRRGTLGPATLATSAVDAYRGRYGEQAVVSAMPECPQVCEPAEPTPDEPDPEPTAADYTAAVQEPERKGLEWAYTFPPGKWKAESQTGGKYGPYWWTIGARPDELHTILLWVRFSNRSGHKSFLSFAEAQAWCQEQEDKLLAEQEGKADGR